MSFAIWSYCNNDPPSLPSQRKKFLVRDRNFLSEEEIYCHRKKFLEGSYLLSGPEIFCQRKKFFVGRKKNLDRVRNRFYEERGRNFFSEQTKFIRGRNFLSKEEISCQRQKCPITRRNFLALDEISCHRKELIFQITAIFNAPVAYDSRCFGRNFRLKVLAPTE